MPYIPAVIHNGKKTFTVLENNPEVMTPLAHKFGISSSLKFYDVYSLDEPTLLAMIPRPCLSLLVIIPFTPAWNAERQAEDDPKSEYIGKGAREPVIWFQQTIGHACGSIGLLHCLLNGPTKEYIQEGSFLEKLREDVIPLGMHERAQYLYDNEEFEHAHQSVASLGDTVPPSAGDGDKLGQHFVAFVKGDDGHLYELEGNRKGPLDRGLLGEEEDVLSDRALDLGMRRLIEIAAKNDGGDLRFSVTALAKDEGE